MDEVRATRALSLLTSYLLLSLCDYASNRSPTLRVNGLERLAPVHDSEGGDQAGQFAGAQQVLHRGRAPSRLALCLEKCFHHEQAAGRDQLEDARHAGSVKIIEYQYRIKSPQLRPRALEIQLSPING